MCINNGGCEHCPARRILAGPRAIAETLPTLGLVVSVTANDAALLSHTGEYLPIALPDDALLCGEDQIGLRMHPQFVNEAYLTPRALTVSNESGYHRAHFTPLSERAGVGALEFAPAQQAEEVDPVDWTDLSWRKADQITHLDALTVDRYKVLPFTGARRIDPEIIPCLFEHLNETDLPFTVGVPGGGCVQLHRGRSVMVGQEGDHVAVVFNAAKYLMAPYFVAECWVTQAHGAAGATSSIELYDHMGRCVTVLTQTGAICPHLHEAWEALAASLPDDER